MIKLLMMKNDTFLKLVKDITSKGFIRSNYKEKIS